jgi:hypothetical protein
MDHHVPGAVTRELRRRGIDVITAFEDHSSQLDDPELLTRATSLGRVLVSMDEDLPIEVARRHRNGEAFAGVIYAHQLCITIGQFIDQLEMFVQTSSDDAMQNKLEYLPFW